MNCLRMSPGTVRKPGAILRKCSAQALRSIFDGRRYWTIAVIMAPGRVMLRHSFASYRYAACGDENLTRREMGHYGPVHTFLRHYKNRVRDEDAKEFWAIIP